MIRMDDPLSRRITL